MEFILFNAELVACNTRKRLLEGLQETPVTFLFSSVETGYCIKITCFIIKVLKKVSKVKWLPGPYSLFAVFVFVVLGYIHILLKSK